MKAVRLIARIAFVLPAAASLVAWRLQPSPEEVARQHCVDKGFAATDLGVLEFRGSQGIVASWETAAFHVKGSDPAKKLVVELRHLLYFLPWQAAEVREEALRR